MRSLNLVRITVVCENYKFLDYSEYKTAIHCIFLKLSTTVCPKKINFEKFESLKDTRVKMTFFKKVRTLLLKNGVSRIFSIYQGFRGNKKGTSSKI